MDENFVQEDGIDNSLVQQERMDENLVQPAREDEKEQGNNVEEVTFPEEVISPEETLLHCARRGQKSMVQDLLKTANEGKIRIDINWKGKDKGKRGYSALHLAAYFGHKDVVQLLLENGADVNILNNDGDTPLHKAAYTGRESTVMLLLEHDANVSIRNAEDQTPKDVSQNKQIRKLLEAAEAHELNKIKEEFLNSARLGDVTKVQERLNDSRLSVMNCQDEYGNTALHLAAQSGQKEVAICLLKSGIDSNIRNKNGLRAEELVQSAQMKQLLAVKPVKAFFTIPHRCEGMLLKKSSFLGWKSHWVLLERGVLSYFKNRGDATSGTKRRGMKYLDEARLFITQDNPFEFLVDFSDGAEHRLSTDLDIYSSKQMERQKWINAFREHIEYSTHYIHKGDVIDDEEEDIVPLVTLQESLKVAEAHQTTLANQIKLFSHMIDSQIAKEDLKPDMLAKIQLELHHISASSKDMCTSLNKCLTLFLQQEEIRQKELKETSEKCRVLEEALHALALEHHELEKTYSEHTPARYYSTDDDEFYDCDEGSVRSRTFSRSYNSEDFDDTMSYKSTRFDDYMKENQSQDNTNKFHVDLQGRTKLPVPMFDRNNFSFWSILKQCIGKELSKITMPVVFNEPLSFLQRITEYMEYATLLNMASSMDNPVDRMMYVAAFAVSSVSSNWERIGKPFNPLLGETYELDRPDLGFHLISEQVSHHPPISAFYVESQTFTFHGSVHPKLKFWGKSVDICPKGIVTLELKKHGESYTWQNVNCCVHNVIVGKLWVEHYGVMEIVNHKTKHKAVLNFKQGGWFGKDLHKIEGFIYDPSKRKVKALYGSWLLDLFGVDSDTYEEHLQHIPVETSSKHSVENGETKSKSDDIEDNIPSHHLSLSDLNIPGQILLWKATPRPENSHLVGCPLHMDTYLLYKTWEPGNLVSIYMQDFDKKIVFTREYFSFTSFALCLNELTEDISTILPPTDARLRPDIRKLEEGNIDAAAEEKNRLEEKQRTTRKERKKQKDEWTPVWFRFGINPVTQKEDWMFTGDYWRRNWSKCPEIF